MGAYFDAVMADNPLAYWRLNEATGSTYADVAGGHLAVRGPSGNFYPGVPSLTLDSEDLALQVDSGASLYSSGDMSWATTSAYTVEAIVKITNPSIQHSIVDRDQSKGDGARGFQWFIGTDGNVYVVITRGASLGVTIGTTGVAVNNGSVHHLAFTHSGGTVRIYINGVERGSGAAAQYTVSQSYIGIGCGYAGSGTEYPGNRPMQGVIDEVAYYGTALSPARIAAHNAARTTVAMTNNLRLGSVTPSAYKLGSTAVTKAYLGPTRILGS